MALTAGRRVAIRRRRAWTLMALWVLAACAGQRSGAQPYVEGHLGVSAPNAMTVGGLSDDRASVCDEYINPRALLIPGCVTPDRGLGDGWQAPYEGRSGWSAAVELGYRFGEHFRLSASLGGNATDFDQTVSSANAMGVDFEKLSNEIDVAAESLGNAVSTELFVWAYRDVALSDGWRLGVGAGLGISRRSLDVAWNWLRSADPAQIATGRDQPNFEQIRNRLAGTQSTGQATVRDDLWGAGVAVSFEKPMQGGLTGGLKMRLRAFEDFDSGPFSNGVLRDHAPNLRLDGSEPVHTWSRTDDTGLVDVSLFLRRTF